MKISTSRLRFIKKPPSVNLTPIIDIVFLLMIFFLLVARFIEAENFPVNVPEKCTFAQERREKSRPLTTLTVLKSEETPVFAVGSQKVSFSSAENLIGKLSELIDSQLASLDEDDSTLVLRIDREIPYEYSQCALAAVARSSAENIRLASTTTAAAVETPRN